GLANVAAGQPLTDVGNGYFSGPSTALAANAPNTAVVQGYLETSNVDMTTQTTAMLSAQRAYQADAQMLQMQDNTMGLAVADLGKVG
ncbi:MAG: flagellar basal body rod C-terminal domain-containing protein, partial [Chloroflexota bacterium]